MSSEQAPPALGIVIPIKSADESVEAFVSPLLAEDHEVVVVEASPESPSSARDDIRRRCQDVGVRWIQAPASRGGQIASGIATTRADLIWVLHIDSSNLAPGLTYLQDLAKTKGPYWGRFDVELRGDHPGLAWVSRAMNWRSRLRRICTGDQGMFFHRRLLDQIGGFPDQPLMEDIEVSKRLRLIGEFRAPRVTIAASGERWLRKGFWRTVFSMWRWRIRYFLGAPADSLYREYYGLPRQSDQ